MGVFSAIDTPSAAAKGSSKKRLWLYLVLGVISCLLVIAAVIQFGDHKEKASVYAQAMDLISDKNYNEAYALLDSLGSYKDAAEHLAKFTQRKTQCHTVTYSMSDQDKIAGQYMKKYAYDESGNMIFEEMFLPDDFTIRISSAEYEYDENGAMVRSVGNLYAVGDITNPITTTIEYDPNGVVIRSQSVLSYGTQEDISVSDIENTFSDTGCVISQKTTKEETWNTPASVTETFYDENGMRVRSITFYTDSSKREIKYDHEGNVCQTTFTDKDGNVTDETDRTQTYEYDDNGNLTKWIEYHARGNVLTTTYSYNEYGNLKEKTVIENGLIGQKDTYTYEWFYTT